MAIWAKRRENETVDKLINRLKKQVQGVRLVQLVRANRYWTKPETKRLVRQSALKREGYRLKRRTEHFYQ